MEPSFKRFCAVKLSVKDIVDGDIHQQDESSGTYLLVNNAPVYRVNLIGVIVHKDVAGSVTYFLIDDGTERIQIKVFEENKNTVEVAPGDGVLVIGKVRIYNTEKYISPEIVKKVSLQWLKVRMEELRLGKDSRDIVATPPELMTREKAAARQEEDIVEKENNRERENNRENSRDSKKKENSLEEEEAEDLGVDYPLMEKKTLLPFQKILNVIKELDDGSGAMVEEVIEKSPIKDTEQLLQKMLEKGEIFTLSPGKVKVL